MSLMRTLSEYRWPIFVGSLLAMSVGSSGVLVWVATRDDAPRPIRGYYEAARTWDVDEAVEAASRELGWTVRFDLPTDVPATPGMPRPVDVLVVDRHGVGVDGLSGRLVAVRPSDTRKNQEGRLTALPQRAGAYRTLMVLDAPGAWDLHVDVTRDAVRFVQTTRFDVPAQTSPEPAR